MATDAPLAKKLACLEWLIAQQARLLLARRSRAPCSLLRVANAAAGRVRAAARSHTRALRCAARQVNLDAVDYVECTALHVAAALGDEPLATRLLKAGASPRAADAEGLTPLHLAARARTRTRPRTAHSS